jgi:hypothetical protein
MARTVERSGAIRVPDLSSLVPDAHQEPVVPAIQSLAAEQIYLRVYPTHPKQRRNDKPDRALGPRPHAFPEATLSVNARRLPEQSAKDRVDQHIAAAVSNIHDPPQVGATVIVQLNRARGNSKAGRGADGDVDIAGRVWE